MIIRQTAKAAVLSACIGTAMLLWNAPIVTMYVSLVLASIFLMRAFAAHENDPAGRGFKLYLGLTSACILLACIIIFGFCGG